jgi:uncharacterized protein YkwD
VVTVYCACVPPVAGSDRPGTSVSGQLTFAPLWQAAVRYNEPVEAPPSSALNNAIVAAVRDAALRTRTREPVADARLFRACDELARMVPEDGVIPYSLVEFALQHNGIIEPSPHLIVAWGDISVPQVVVDRIRPQLAGILADGTIGRLGIGAAKRMPGGYGAVVFALQSVGLITSPIPRSVPAGGGLAIEASVDARYRNPRVDVTRDDGSVESVVLRPTRVGAFSAEIPCSAAAGKQQISITALHARGSALLANFPVWCGAEPPRTLTVVPSRDDAPASDAAEVERRVFALVNRDREAAGLSPLNGDEEFAEVARDHSREMYRTRVVAQVVPTTGSITERARLARRNVIVHANVARTYGVEEAHHALMNTPSTRASLMSALTTHMAVGVVLGDEVAGRRELFMTQVFTHARPRVDPSQAATAVRTHINAIRTAGSNPELDAIAQALAESIADGKTRAQAYAPLEPRRRALASQYARIETATTNLIELDAFDAASFLGDARPDDIGVGIGQGTHDELGDNAIFIVVLLATRR